jgi:hypothetical protein
VAHGCLAGLQKQACDEVYHARILRGSEAYSTFKLGAIGSDLGAVTCFFETQWSLVSPRISKKSTQAALLSDAAFCLFSLGRLNEALVPGSIGLAMNIDGKTLLTTPEA